MIAIRDIAPRAPTHILLLPAAHIASAAELTEADGAAARPDLRGGRRARPVRGDRRRRLPARHERRALGRPDRRPPPFPPDGRPGVRMAARMTRAARRSSGARRRRGRRARGLRASGARPTSRRDRRSRPLARPARSARPSPRRAPSSSAPSAAQPRPAGLQAARTARRRARCSPPRRGPSYQVILPRRPERRLHRRLRVPDPTTPRPRQPRPRRPTSRRARPRSSRRRGARTSSGWSGRRSCCTSWVPEGAEDPMQPDIQAALETSGRACPVPS